MPRTKLFITLAAGAVLVAALFVSAAFTSTPAHAAPACSKGQFELGECTSTSQSSATSQTGGSGGGNGQGHVSPSDPCIYIEVNCPQASAGGSDKGPPIPCLNVPLGTGYWDTAPNSLIRKVQDKVYTAYQHMPFSNTTPYQFDPSYIHPSDGIFGINTINAVKDFQNQQKLKIVDGTVGSETWKALGGC